MLNLGAEYGNLDGAYSVLSIFRYAAEAANNSELVEGTTLNHSYLFH